MNVPNHSLTYEKPCVARDRRRSVSSPLAQAAERARQPELIELSDNLFYTDLGIVECPVDETRPKDTRTTCSEAPRIGLSLLESVASRKFPTHAAAVRALGLSTEKARQHRILTRLERTARD